MQNVAMYILIHSILADRMVGACFSLVIDALGLPVSYCTFGGRGPSLVFVCRSVPTFRQRLGWIR